MVARVLVTGSQTWVNAAVIRGRIGQVKNT